MKTVLQITTMLFALSISGLAVLHFPIASGSDGKITSLATAPEIKVTPLVNGAGDNLENNKVVYE